MQMRLMAGVHSPLRDEDEGLCKLPAPVGLSCHRRSLASAAMLVCPCKERSAIGT